MVESGLSLARAPGGVKETADRRRAAPPVRASGAGFWPGPRFETEGGLGERITDGLWADPVQPAIRLPRWPRRPRYSAYTSVFQSAKIPTRMTPNIDFRSIRAHAGSQDRAFEELCFRLVPFLEHLPEGTELTRHGTPDGGVEFLAALPDGEVWGWQAKYLFALGNSEFQQLDRSAREALNAFPQLTRYTFCLPYNRPAGKVSGRKSAMQKWAEHRDKWQRWGAERDAKVQFAYVGESELLSALTRRDQAGPALYWFNAKILSPDWFKETVDRAIADAGPRYTPELNVELPIASVFEGLGRTELFQVRLRTQLRAIRDKRRWHAASRVSTTDYPDLAPAVSDLQQALDQPDSRVLAIQIPGSHPVDFGAIAHDCGALTAKLYDLADELSKRADEIHGEASSGVAAEQARRSRESWKSAAWELRRTASELLELKDLVEGDAARLVNLPALLLTGNPGTGKTHLLCDIAQQRVSEGRPTILLLGNRFDQRPPWTQILEHLQLNCTPDQLLGALDAAAQATGSRVLILIDAINEGSGLALWPKYLTSFLSDIRQRPRIGAVLACRTSYLPAVLPRGLDDTNFVRVDHHGFAGHEYEAVKTFFNYYNLMLPDFPLLLPEFQNPLFLKLMCQGLQEQGTATIPRGSTGVTRLFGLFLASAEDRLASPERLDYRREDSLLGKAVRSLANEMLDKNTHWLPLDLARDAVDKFLPNRPWSKSLFSGLLDEGVLARELMGWKDTSEVVSFSYQRLGDHLRAVELCERNPSRDGIANLCRQLAAEEHTAYQNSGLLEALSVHIPERFQVELHELLPNASLPPVQEAYLESLIWRDPAAFPDEPSFDYLNQIATSSYAGHISVIETLLQLACVPNHPFNAELLHRALWRLSIPRRDSWWSAFLHHNYAEGTPVWRIVDWAWSNETDYCADDAALLCATTLAWYLTSSNRFLRDRSTKALVSLLRRRPSVLRQLVQRFHEVNDPYVAERIYAVAYGCSLATVSSAVIEELALLVYKQVFESGAPPVHILLRDYARGVIEQAASLGCLHHDIDLAKVKPPYKSPWPITAPSEEALTKKFREDKGWLTIWSSVMSWGDFHRYQIEPAIRHFLAPNQRRRLAAARRRARESAEESWTKLARDLTTEQLNTLGTATEYAEVERVLSEDQMREYAAVARQFEFAQTYNHPVTSDLQLASRWVLNRVASLGWRPELFEDFDRSVNFRDASRSDHKPERIGKKYQWIALHELVARLADHCIFLSEGSTNSPSIYQGPWQLWLRDLDPSLLMRSTARERSFGSQTTWWANASPPVPVYPSPAERQQWLQSDADLPDPLKLIAVEDPSGERWFTLEGHYNWDEEPPPEEERYGPPRCGLWFQVRSYLLRTEHLTAFSEWAADMDWMGRWMPESYDLYKIFLGEYAWHPSSASYLVNWSQGSSFFKHQPPTPLVVTAAHYVCEGNVRDCSVDDFVTGSIPSSKLISGLGLSWSGNRFAYLDTQGRMAAFDPSATEPGPSALLICERSLREYLRQQQLSLVWTVLGEKLIYSMSDDRIGRLEVSGAVSLADDSLQRINLTSKFVPY